MGGYQGPFTVLVCLFAVQAVYADTAAYLHIDGMEGESRAEAREGWIDLLSISHAASRADEASPGAFGDVVVVKEVDRATPLLNQACASGALFPEAILDFVRRDTGFDQFYRVRLTDVMLRGIGLQGPVAGSDRPLESIRLAFATIEWTYTEFDTSGGPVAEHVAWWDLAARTGGSGTVPYEEPPPAPDGFRRSVRFSLLGGEGEMRGVLSWTSESGKTYGVYTSPSPDEPYDTLVTTVPSSGDGVTSTTVEMSGKRRFFVVREVD